MAIEATTAAHVTPIKDTFKAWINRMPGSDVEPTLHVIGWTICNTSGWTVELRRAEPQSINPTILILDLVGTPPSGQALQMRTPEPVRHSEEATQPYKQVQIRSGEDSFTIDVEEVS